MPVSITSYQSGDSSVPEANQFWVEMKALVDLVNNLEQRVISLESRVSAHDATLQLHTTQILALKLKVGG